MLSLNLAVKFFIRPPLDEVERKLGSIDGIKKVVRFDPFIRSKRPVSHLAKGEN